MQSHGTEHRPFVLTYDLGHRLQALRRVGLKTPGVRDDLVLKIQSELRHDVSSVLPEGSVVDMRMGDLSTAVRSIAQHRWPDAFVVSACPEIFVPLDGMNLEVSRLYGLRGEYIGVGPRPGFPSLAEQIRSIAQSDVSRGVVIVEDGIYTGETLQQIISSMKACRITPAGFVAGFAFTQAQHIIEQTERGGTEVVLSNQLNNPFAWHPDHDFFPFISGAGRVVGFKMNGRHRTNLFPLHTYDGSSYAFPYLPQFCDSTRLWVDWTGLPETAVETVGSRCTANTILLIEELERLNSRKILIGDLVAPGLRTSVPLQVGQSDFPHLDTRAVDYLASLG